MTKQEIFNAITIHLLTQKERSVDCNGECMYRGRNGLKCAVGALIKDEFYKESLETKGLAVSSVLHALIESEVLPKGTVYWDSVVHFMMELQEIHDKKEPADWKTELQKLASQVGLDSKVLEQF